MLPPWHVSAKLIIVEVLHSNYVILSSEVSIAQLINQYV